MRDMDVIPWFYEGVSLSFTSFNVLLCLWSHPWILIITFMSISFSKLLSDVGFIVLSHVASFTLLVSSANERENPIDFVHETLTTEVLQHRREESTETPKRLPWSTNAHQRQDSISLPTLESGQRTTNEINGEKFIKDQLLGLSLSKGTSLFYPKNAVSRWSTLFEGHSIKNKDEVILFMMMISDASFAASHFGSHSKCILFIE